MGKIVVDGGIVPTVAQKAYVVVKENALIAADQEVKM